LQTIYTCSTTKKLIVSVFIVNSNSTNSKVKVLVTFFKIDAQITHGIKFSSFDYAGSGSFEAATCSSIVDEFPAVLSEISSADAPWPSVLGVLSSSSVISMISSCCTTESAGGSVAGVFVSPPAGAGDDEFGVVGGHCTKIIIKL
jgi:hypothetical protein